MNIIQNDLVLEVGSGDKPYPRSDVLLDKYPDDSSEREAGRELVVDRPIVIGDVENLPFADKSFDYIISSHVLEHANNPAKFLDELSRVGKRGYIGTPLPLRERVFDWSFHRWYVYQEKRRLVLVRKTAKSKKYFAGMSTKKRKDFYFSDGKILPNLGFEWEAKIYYEILPEEPAGFLEGLDRELNSLLRSVSINKSPSLVTFNLPSVKSKLFQIKCKIENKVDSRKRKNNVNLFSLIVCPKCMGKLAVTQETLFCLICHKVYNFYGNGIPVLQL